ncbi:ELMO domain-containing protein 2 [Coccinella septempunctata]|uniref:ELMO domain-containing protein 2 n=1 Tax=Coccinella septempunctata TaxID=41139 RepID=UPI001D068FCA|nr:ELMO domain-containing protein 2 [Coccinella septempunctata]
MLNLWWFLTSYVRSVVKWFLRKTTGLCELQRICYGEVSGAPRILAVERSLNLSKSPQLKKLVSHLNDISDNLRLKGSNEREILTGAVSTVLLVKKINPRIHFQFVKNFSKCVEQIWGYRQLIAEIESLRTVSFDSENAEHEEKLLKLWKALMPDDKLASRICKQWQDIGFQGEDPKTDFRGMGILGLENLLFFATEYEAAARHVLSHSHHPAFGYCFAIVGINLTSMALQLVRSGDAKTYFYNNSKCLPSIRLFHQFYSFLFYEFDRYWLECEPADIMEFSSIRTKFENNIRNSLMDPRTVYKINIWIDTV